MYFLLKKIHPLHASLLLFLCGPSFAFAQSFTPLSEGLQSLNIRGDSIGPYFNSLFDLALTFGAILAVLVIATAGLQYMTTDAVSGKGQSKERIQQAILGLLMLLGTWLFFNEINPNIASLTIRKDVVVVEPTTTQQQTSARPNVMISPFSEEGVMHCREKSGQYWCYPSKEKCVAENKTTPTNPTYVPGNAVCKPCSSNSTVARCLDTPTQYNKGYPTAEACAAAAAELQSAPTTADSVCTINTNGFNLADPDYVWRGPNPN